MYYYVYQMADKKVDLNIVLSAAIKRYEYDYFKSNIKLTTSYSVHILPEDGKHTVRGIDTISSKIIKKLLDEGANPLGPFTDPDIKNIFCFLRKKINIITYVLDKCDYFIFDMLIEKTDININHSEIFVNIIKNIPHKKYMQMIINNRAMTRGVDETLDINMCIIMCTKTLLHAYAKYYEKQVCELSEMFKSDSLNIKMESVLKYIR
jgi:hypothetical protein